MHIMIVGSTMGSPVKSVLTIIGSATASPQWTVLSQLLGQPRHHHSEQCSHNHWVSPGIMPVPAGEALALQAAYLACLAEAFSTRQPHAGLHALLRTLVPPGAQQPSDREQQPRQQHGHQQPQLEDQRGQQQHGQQQHSKQRHDQQQPSPPAFVRQLLAASTCPQPALRIEALAALKGLAMHYTFTLPGACVCVLRFWC